MVLPSHDIIMHHNYSSSSHDADHQNPSGLHRALAVIAIVGLFVAIAVILKSRGLRVVVNACMFVASLVSTQLGVKVLQSPPFSYRFPGFVTVLHFSCVVVACAIFFAYKREPIKVFPCSIPCKKYLRTVVPIALSQPVSVVFNNTAMGYVGAAICAIIGTLSPVATALLSRTCGRRMQLLSWLGILVAFVGALIISWGEVSEAKAHGTGKTVTGLIFAFTSLSGRCIKIVLLDYMIAPVAYADNKAERELEEPMSVMHVYALTYSGGAFMSLLYSLWTESIVEAWNQLTLPIFGIVMCTAASALVLNFTGGYALADLGASAQQIIGKLNTIVISAFSVAFLGEHLPAVVLLGTACVLCGVAIFERGEHKASDEDDSESDSSSDSDGESEDKRKTTA
jgi:drug/metabolite transporter (DMT)-like permease